MPICISPELCLQVMKQLIYLLPTCTDREALNLAIFYHETFIIMERWRVCCLRVAKDFCNRPRHNLIV